MSKTSPIILLAFVSSACFFNSVTKLDAEAKHVHLVTDTDKPSECKFLGKITATSHADDEKLARQGAENELRNRAAELRGNFAVIEQARGGRIGTTSQREVVINGKAYHCRTLDMQVAEEEKAAQALAEKEEREAKAEAEEQARLEEEKAKREQEEKDRAEKEQAEKEEKKSKKGKKSEE
ncbi:MAG: DUF4156 domain-containing protein [Myxococcales bacterium]